MPFKPLIAGLRYSEFHLRWGPLRLHTDFCNMLHKILPLLCRRMLRTDVHMKETPV